MPVVGRTAPRPITPDVALTGLLPVATVGASTAVAAALGQRYERLGRFLDGEVLLAAVPVVAVAAGLWRLGPGVSEVVAGLDGTGCRLWVGGQFLGGSSARRSLVGHPLLSVVSLCQPGCPSPTSWSAEGLTNLFAQ